MNPRRLIPYLVIFLVLAGTYVGLRWRQEQQAAQEEQAKKVFQVKAPDIGRLSLIRGKTEVVLVKRDQEWYLTAPLQTKADQTVVDNLLSTLARLRRERDLGLQKDLKAFGLASPAVVVKFTAGGQVQQLAIGAQVPGGAGYYVLRNRDPRLLIISRGSKDSLDRKVLALRDKSLVSFISGEVTGLKIKTGKTKMDLKKTGPQAWEWAGRPDFRVRSDRVEKLLRDLNLSRAKDFPEAMPGKKGAWGLGPGRGMEITVVTPKGEQHLFLGKKLDGKLYARKGAAGPVMQVEASLPDEIDKTLASLEDHRLWSGDIMAVRRVVWGAPGQTWTAAKVKDANTWKISGPGRTSTQQPSILMEMTLHNFQKLEAVKILPATAAPGPPIFVLDLFDEAGKSLLHLEAFGPVKKDGIIVRTQKGERKLTVLAPPAKFRQWQEEMARLTTAPEKGGSAPPGKGKAGKGAS
jgi:hypothetical protein